MIEVRGVSRWYGNVVAVNDVSMTLGVGVTGLLGPNGAGKTTLLHMMAGLLEPSRGSMIAAGVPVWRNPEVYRLIGLVSERESVHGFLTGWELVHSAAKLHRLPDPTGAARRAIAMVELGDAQHRRLETYSKGMRQRARVAAALVHQPGVLLLDEPFNGMDPRQRMQMMELLHAMGAEGHTVLFSSHILEEVEQVSGTVQVMVAGRLAASGDFRTIRRLMTNRPHVFSIRSSDDRRLAVELMAQPSVSGVDLDEAGLQVRAGDYGAFTVALPRVARDAGSGCASCCRPTSRWRASSPTWSPPEDGARMNPTIASITARGLIGRRRLLLLLPLPVILIGLALLARATGADPAHRAGPVMVGLGIAVVLPLVALVVGTGVLGLEIDDGTLLHVLTKPLPRSEIVLTKLAVACATTVAIGSGALFVAGTITAGARVGAGFAVGGAVAAVAYSALFEALSLVTRRPVLVGLIYVVLWEGLLGNVVSGTGVLSIQQYAVTIAAKVADTDLVSGRV
jgi:ABC-2 type transport system ATP-binding protein